MCNNNRPKLTPEQKMVNAIFHSAFGETVYKEEDLQAKPTPPLYILDADTQGEYMVTLHGYIKKMADEAERYYKDYDPESFLKAMKEIQDALKVMLHVIDGLASDTDMEVLEQWADILEYTQD